MKQHTVEAGECLTSIAAHYGFSVDTIWNLADNASLKDKRKNPNTLVPGDIVAIPDRREKVVSCETAKTHRFKLSADSAICRLQLFEDEKAVANQDFELKIGTRSYKGTTDNRGVLEVAIPCKAKEGILTIGPDKKILDLQFGYLQPISETKGVEARLRNLGFTNEKIEDALKAFQKRFGLQETGNADEATTNKLTDLHDSVCEFPQ